MRKMTSLAKQAILSIHQKRLSEALSLLKKAQSIKERLDQESQSHPDLIFTGMHSAALQEYSEARIFTTLVKDGKFTSPRKIDVPPIDYALGLADVVGEYRRFALDALREGNIKKSERSLETMDTIYVELMGMDEAYALVSGLRRKCDLARRIIEVTRGDITQEVRRNQLERRLKQFEKTLKNRRA